MLCSMRAESMLSKRSVSRIIVTLFFLLQLSSPTFNVFVFSIYIIIKSFFAWIFKTTPYIEVNNIINRVRN